MRALLIEASPHYHNAIKRFLGRAGFEVVSTATAANSTLLALHTLPQILLLDWSLPYPDDVLRNFRSLPAARFTPCVATMRQWHDDRHEAAALAAGANLCISKAEFETHAAIVRKRFLGLVQRPSLHCDRVYSIGELKFYPEIEKLVIGGRMVRISGKDAQLFEIFIRRPNVVHKFELLWNNVWVGAAAEWRHILENRVSRLRGILGVCWGAKLIAHKGVGFVFETFA